MAQRDVVGGPTEMTLFEYVLPRHGFRWKMPH